MLTDDPDPATGNLIIQLVLLAVLILINAFFAMSEIAIISLNDAKIKKMAEEGHKKAKKVVKLTAESSAFLSTIQVGVTLAGFLTSASASQAFVESISGWLMNILHLQLSYQSLVNGVATVIVTIIMSYFSLVFGELAPKRIAMKYSEKVSFAVVGPLLFIKAVMKPAIKVLSFSTNLIIRLFGVDPNADDEHVTEEEIRMMVDVGEEKGVIEESQKEMINNIFEFDDICVQDIMTHRTEITAVEVTDEIIDVVQESMKMGFSRIPVYEDDLDNVVGIIYVKDLLQFIGEKVPSGSSIADLMRPAFFVPESKKCGALFTEMTEKHIQMAVVVDEYGGTAGLVTMEDLIESILGNIQDEYDNESEDIEQVSENIFTVEGTTDIEEVSELLGRELPEGDYDTLGGMIMSYLGRIPEPGEQPSIEVANTLFTVVSLDERRIDKVLVEKLPEPEPEIKEDAKDKDKDKETKEKEKDKPKKTSKS